MSTNLAEIANALVANGKGILAADESTSTIGKRFADIDVENVEDNRRQWRQLMFETEGLEKYISGVIMFDETVRQNSSSGTPFVETLTKKGIIPGIKVDLSTIPLPKSNGEFITAGLDGLRERFKEYYELGARFAKWRAVIKIGAAIPTRYCIEANAHALGRYASLSQECGLVPIVEPEVLMDGDHSIEHCGEVSKHTLLYTFNELAQQGVNLREIILKPNMVLSATDNANRSGTAEVAKQTLECLMSTVPPLVPGIAFLSGGQEDEEATVNLNSINVEAQGHAPWKLTFSYGRGLQASPLKVWQGKNEQIGAAQKQLLKCAKNLSLASLGQYAGGH